MSNGTSPHAPISVAIVDTNTDPLTQYLVRRNIATEVAYLGDTDFELGRRATLGNLAITYRVESQSLLICEIRSLSTPNSLGSALRQFLAFILQLDGALAGIDVVRGIMPFLPSGMACQSRERLCRIYLRRGAKAFHRSDGDLEIQFPIRSVACPSPIAREDANPAGF